MRRINTFFFAIIQIVIVFDSTKQSRIRQAAMTVKAIGKTIKSPLVIRIGNTIKNPIIKTFSNTIKKSVGIFHHNKNTIKNLACGLQEKYLKSRHSLGRHSVKYLGEKGVKKFEYVSNWTIGGGKQLFKRQNRKNIQIKSAAWMQGEELRSLINMASKNKHQLSLFFATGGLSKLAQFNIVTVDEIIGRYNKGGDVNDVTGQYVEPTDEQLKNPLLTKTFKEKLHESDLLKQAKEHKKKKKADDEAFKKMWNSGRGKKKTIEKDTEKTVEEILKKAGKDNVFVSPEDSKQPDDIIKVKTKVEGEIDLAEGLKEPTDIDGQYKQPSKEEMKNNMELNKNWGAEQSRKETPGKGSLKNKPPDKGYYENEEFKEKDRFNQENGKIIKGGPTSKKTQGQIKIKYKGGECYEGDFVKNQLTGKGKLTFPNENEYIGDFVNGQIQGKGIYTFQSGNWYEGDFVGGYMHGKGKQDFTDGNKYVGDFADDKINGKGTYFFQNGSTQKGDFVKGKLQGKGDQVFENGDTYKGTFLGNLMHGSGKLTQKSGTTYEGAFMNGLFHGKGIQNNCDISIYDGDFVDGFFFGYGTLKSAGGRFYKGYFVDSKYQGKGDLTYSDGDHYRGYFRNGKFQGKGRYVYANGNYYDGEYKEDKLNGKGTYKWKDGSFYKGEWLDDLYNGKGEQYTESTGKTEKGYFKFGKFIGSSPY